MKNKIEKNNLERYAPLGISLSSEIFYYKLIMIISTLWSMQFIVRYLQELNELYYRERHTIFRDDIQIVSFEHLMNGVFFLFGVAFIYAIIISVYHYFYHYQGSKMMYLMKRLPNKWELHKRCLVLPIVAVAFTIGYIWILRILYYAIYLICTPQRYLAI